jgi:hypothetical protein
MRVSFDDFKSGGLHEKHAVATWNLGTISRATLGARLHNI